MTIVEVLDIALLHSKNKNIFKYDLGGIQNLQAMFDQRRMQQVLLNMLLNAIKFSQNGTIELDI